MLKKDKNGFLQIIKESGFEPEQFNVLEEIRDGFPAFVIQFKNSPFEFCTRNAEDDYKKYDYCSVTFTPSFKRSEYHPANEWLYEIKEVYKSFSYWLKNDIKDYIEENEIPDLWKILKEGQENFKWQDSNDEDFSYFSVVEQKAISEAITEFREKILVTYEPSTEQLEEIDKKLTYLSGAVEKLNRFDWKSVLLSTILGIATTLSLDTTTGQTLFNIAKHIISSAILLLK